MRAALYARVSTPGQGEEDKASIPEQIARIEKYCQEKGYVIVDRYVDIGYSGAKSKRPEFQRMLTNAKDSKFDVLVCWKADRLSRCMFPAAALMEITEPLGISLEAVEEHLDVNYFAMLAVVGKMELDNMKARIRMGQEARANRGKMQGRAPFGYFYDVDTGRYEIDEKEGGVVRWIFDLYIGGIPTRQIAAKLNATGTSTKGRSRLGWTPSKVSDLLSKRFYYGEGYYNRRANSVTKQKLKPMEAWIPLEYPALVSREIFEAALARKDSNNHFCSGRSGKVYLLPGLLFCEECGKKFYLSRHSGDFKYRLIDGTEKICHRKRDIARYVCLGLRNYPHIYNCRTPKQIWVDEIEYLVWSKLDEALRNPEMLRIAIETRAQELQAGLVDERERLRQATDVIEKSKLEEQWLITQARKQYITEDQMHLQLLAIREERETWDEELRRIKEAKIIQNQQEDILAKAKETCSQLVGRLDYLLESSDLEALKERQAIARLLIDRVTVDRFGQVTIQFAIPELSSEPVPVGVSDTGWLQPDDGL